jgi:biopolymer transport protein ExbB/TolQ
MSKAVATGIGLLEEKINKAADLIAQLRAEKNKLESANKELKEKIDSLYISNEELTKQIEELKKSRAVSKNTEKRREEITVKIEEMLEKLERIEL